MMNRVMHCVLTCLPKLVWIPGQGKRLGLRLVMNHVLWGVGIGLILSLSKIGPKWLDPGAFRWLEGGWAGSWVGLARG